MSLEWIGLGVALLEKNKIIVRHGRKAQILSHKIVGGTGADQRPGSARVTHHLSALRASLVIGIGHIKATFGINIEIKVRRSDLVAEPSASYNLPSAINKINDCKFVRACRLSIRHRGLLESEIRSLVVRIDTQNSIRDRQ